MINKYMFRKGICLLVIIFLAGCGLENELTGFAVGIIEEPSTNLVKETPTKTTDSIKLASFNIQTLGKSKVSKDLVKQHLPNIINQFDVILIQELRDISPTTLDTLKLWFPEYDFLVSERLGRSSSKEQYILMYKVGQVHSDYVYNDFNDVFEREPHIILFELYNNNVTLINNHIKPSDALNEIVKLEQVINDAIATNKDNDFFLVGDLNADCSYYDEDLDHLRQYNWIIGNDADTNLAKSSCSYDRIISNMQVSNSGIYNFQEELGITMEEAKVISDHYPVWIEITS
jgi:endonuclease/exonuclease/phosphatase family metal-dependent hydrolase